MLKRFWSLKKLIEMNGQECSSKKLRIHTYKPFKKIKGFHLAVYNKTAKFLFFYKDKKGYVLHIKKDGYIPKSGIFLCDKLVKSVNLSKKTILDIGTGESGIIALHSSFFGAKKVTAVDIDSKAVQWAEKNAKTNGIKNIEWKRSDLFKNVNGLFDIIVSNPPQMPMRKKVAHDAGGATGRKYIEEIIENAPRYLHSDGKLILLIFDFLGIDRSYGENPSLFEYYKKKKFKPRIIGKIRRVIKEGGQTQKALNDIRKKYPRFKFFKDNEGNLSHEIFIVSATIKRNTI